MPTKSGKCSLNVKFSKSNPRGKCYSFNFAPSKGTLKTEHISLRYLRTSGYAPSNEALHGDLVPPALNTSVSQCVSKAIFRRWKLPTLCSHRATFALVLARTVSFYRWPSIDSSNHPNSTHLQCQIRSPTARSSNHSRLMALMALNRFRCDPAKWEPLSLSK